MSHEEINQLATYNAEISRGLLHSQEWIAKMQELQRRFDREYAAQVSERWWSA
jgi:hypothetical protein